MIIENIECEDKSVDITGIEPGDLYMAKKYTYWKLLTCKKFCKKTNIVFPQEKFVYCSDGYKCFKVKK